MYKLGDKVIHQIKGTNQSYRGEIVMSEAILHPDGTRQEPELAFRGEHNFFSYLSVCQGNLST